MLDKPLHAWYYIKAIGGIAQLGERLNGIKEVSGSIPLISTKTSEVLWFRKFFLIFQSIQ